jgi:endonuclease/exonuclease/phosphatase family metal-dependent hydrolase
MDFWAPPNKKDWVKKVARIINSFDADFLLLQETNPKFHELIPNYNIYYQDHKVYKSTKTVIENNDFNNDSSNIFIPKIQDFSKMDNKENLWPSWGSAIIVKKEHTLKKQYQFYSKYVGSSLLMCYEFEIMDKTFILINIYAKKDCYGKNHLYTTTLHRMISDVEEIILYNREKYIIMAGDFNLSEQPVKGFPKGVPINKSLFNRLENLGLINCTLVDNKYIRTTENEYYQRDYFFVNEKLYSCKNGDIITYNQYYLEHTSDHYALELNFDIENTCTITSILKNLFINKKE